jgi:hypothetical protein
MTSGQALKNSDGVGVTSSTGPAPSTSVVSPVIRVVPKPGWLWYERPI